MSIAINTKNPIELRNAGIKALNAALGSANAQAFLNQRGCGDFTKERHERPERTNEEILADVLRIQEEEADFIAAKNAAWDKKMTAANKSRA
jgi:hypothetical protein